MRVTVILLIFLFSLYSKASEVVYLNAVKNKISKTIVRVKSGNKYSTGFFYKTGSQVVTTLHSIGNPDDIEIYIPNESKWCSVTLKKIFKSADLVLLQSSGCQSANFIAGIGQDKPATDTEVFTIGYYGTNDKYQDIDLTVGLLQGNQLKDLLGPSARQSIKSVGFPSLNTEIFYLKGQLVHGFSGSPIVNRNGVLLGVSDGGLENGAVGISWCVTSKSLVGLESATDTFPAGSMMKAQNLFAAEDYGGENLTVSNGSYTFEKVRTRTFAQLDATANYQQYPEIGLKQVLSAFSSAGIEYDKFSYDIYVESSTGATVVLPSGLQLLVDNGVFYTEDDKENVSTIIVLSPTSDIQASSTLFEQGLMQLTNIYTWQADTRVSYSYPFVRADNMIVNRKGWFNYNPNGYVMEVIAGKGNAFLGVAAILENQFDFNTYEFYDQGKAAKYLLASQLTTFTY